MRARQPSDWLQDQPGHAREENSIPATIDGRRVISRADMIVRGVSRQSLFRWYRDRAVTGYPEKAGQVGGMDVWYEDEWTAWHEAHLREKVERLTEVDREGAPEDLVDAAEAARILGYRSRDVIHANRRLGIFPEPDDYGTTSKGHRAPLWKRATVWAAADNRKGLGGAGKTGTAGAPSKPHPYSGDPRLTTVLEHLRSGLEPSSAGLAATWDVSQRTAERIIKAAREHLTVDDCRTPLIFTADRDTLKHVLQQSRCTLQQTAEN
jgi:hypothetical protein